MEGLALTLAPRRPNTAAASTLGGDGGQSLSLAHGHDVPAAAPKFDNNADSLSNSVRYAPLGGRSTPAPAAGNSLTLSPLGGGRSTTTPRTAAGTTPSLSSYTLSGATTSAPPFDPTARNGNTPSANFTASVKRDQALAGPNAALQAQRNSLMAAADAAAPPIRLTDPATGAPKMGTAYARLSDGTEVTRQYQQTAESPLVKQARAQALNLTLSPDDQAKGQQAFDDSLADARQRYDLAHLPPLDPKALVANALATKYTKEGDAAKVRADNDTTVSQARADVLKEQRERLAALTPVEKQKLSQQVQTLVSQGKLAEAHALLTGEQIQTEQQTRPGKVRGQQIRNQATQDANDRANQNQPVTTFRTLAEAYKATHDSFGNALPGAPQQPDQLAQSPAPGGGGGLALQPARPATTQPAAAVPTSLPPLAPPPPPPQPAGTMQPLPPAPTLPATRPAAPAVAQQQQAAPGGGIARVTTAADYAAIPSGTQYYDPSGHLRTKR